MMKEVTSTKLSPRQQAQKELEKEQFEDAVAKMKNKLNELSKARKIVENLEREVDDLEKRIEEGSV